MISPNRRPGHLGEGSNSGSTCYKRREKGKWLTGISYFFAAAASPVWCGLGQFEENSD